MDDIAHFVDSSDSESLLLDNLVSLDESGSEPSNDSDSESELKMLGVYMYASQNRNVRKNKEERRRMRG